MRRSVRRAGAVTGLLALAAVTAFGGSAMAAPSKFKSPSQAMAEAAKGSHGGSGGLKVVAEGLNNPLGSGIGPRRRPVGPVDLGFSGWTGYLLVSNPGGSRLPALRGAQQP